MEYSIVSVLMERDDLSKQEAIAQVKKARARVAKGEDPEDILSDEFGLEPDYIFDLL